MIEKIGDFNKSLLTAFLVGSSFPVFLPFFFRVAGIERRYSYFWYSLVNPLYFGLVNTALTYWYLIRSEEDLSLKQLYFMVGLASVVFVFCLAVIFQSYDFGPGPQQKSYLKYFLTLLLAHGFTYNVTLYYLSKWVVY